MEAKKDLTVYIAIAVIIVSLVSIGFNTLTGNVTQGFVNISVVSSAAINFSTDQVDWGVGVVDTGKDGADLWTNGTVVDGNWTAVSTGLVIENIGNVNVTLNVTSDSNAATFLGGTSGGGPVFEWILTENKATACNGGDPTNITSYTTITTSATWACQETFDFDSNRDEIELDFHLYVPSDSSTGDRSALITTTATAV